MSQHNRNTPKSRRRLLALSLSTWACSTVPFATGYILPSPTSSRLLRQQHHFQQKNLHWRESSDAGQKATGNFHRHTANPTCLRANGQWDGDDLRYISRLRRRIRRSFSFQSEYDRPVRNTLIAICTMVFVWQTISTVQWIARTHPAYWPSKAPFIIWDAVLGTAKPGPFTRDFRFTVFRAQRQPHRWLSSGFVHGSLLHLALNIDALRRQPAWLETGLGGGLYMTTFLLSIVAGNLGYSHLGLDGVNVSSVVLGASGGICGLYGLQWISMAKMGNSRTFSVMIRPLALMGLYGALLGHVSNAVHIGGFFGGVVLGLLCGPRYNKSYTMRRKWSVDADDGVPRDYRNAMGFGIKPSNRGFLPLPILWLLLAGLVVATVPSYQTIPKTILKGLSRPGSL